MDGDPAIWFSYVHSSKLPSAISRYRNEIRRVLGVLNTALEGKSYLVGDKVTIADLSFVPWHSIIPVGSSVPRHSSQAVSEFVAVRNLLTL
jgi:glutathione S-transferase